MIRGIAAVRLLDLDEATDSGFAALVARRAATDVRACYACGKCSAGCPLAVDMDLQPHQVMHLINLGRRGDVLNCRSIWLCASCVTCTVRCPHDVDLARVMDVLRELSLHDGVRPAEPGIVAFNRSFLSVLRWGGKLHELSMTVGYKLLSRDLLTDLLLGVGLLRRGKLKLLPGRARSRRRVAAIFDRVRRLDAEAADGEVSRV
jgi:heterodisulfide reductase subunit C